MIDGRHAEVRIPRALVRVMGRSDDIRSKRDQDLNAFRAVVIEGAKTIPLPADVELHNLRMWRSAARFVWLLRRWPGEDAPEALREVCEEWRRRDRHLWQYEVHERQQHSQVVANLYRELGAWVKGWAGALAVDGWNVTEVAAAPTLGEEEDIRARLGRKVKQRIAPGLLRSTLVRAAKAQGLTVKEFIPEFGVGFTHVGCGGRLGTGAVSAEAVVLVCPDCGVAVDQDVNAADWLLENLWVGPGRDRLGMTGRKGVGDCRL